MAVMRFRPVDSWRKAYKDKEQLLLDGGYSEVCPEEFYRDLFPKGSLQEKGVQGDGKANIIACNIMKTVRRRIIISDDLSDLQKLMEQRFGLIGPYTCYGKSYASNRIHQIFAIVIDIDYVTKVKLKALLNFFENWGTNRESRLPPTYLVSSGLGVHLYYFLDEPINLFKYRYDSLSELKMAMTRYLWNDFTSLSSEVDVSGIAQGFRCVGSLSRLCQENADGSVVTKAYPVKAYRISGRRYSLYELRDSVPGCNVDIDAILQKPIYEDRYHPLHTLEEAKMLYPDWYERRVVNHEPAIPHEKSWTCSRKLYEWWKRKMRNEARVGGRYFAIIALCCFGRKCGISDGKIQKDAWTYFDAFDNLSVDETNRFTREDMKAALAILKDPDAMKTVKRSRKWIEGHTKIPIPPAKRRKKPLKRDDGTAFKAARMIQDLQDPNGDWRNKKGQPIKKSIVECWQSEHPAGSKIECERDTGLSRHTVLKWWNDDLIASEE